MASLGQIVAVQTTTAPAGATTCRPRQGLTDSEVILSFTNVTKTIAKIGNSQGIIFDVALMDLTRLKVGDQLVVTVHDGGTITLTPIHPAIEAERAGATAKRLIGKNEELFRRLS